MEITTASWNAYAKQQEEIRKKASELMQKWIDKNGVEDRDAMIKYAKALSDKYGEAAGSYACNMYDAIAKAQKALIDDAIPAEVAEYGEVAKAINGSLKQSQDGSLVSSTLERLVKQVAEDTMLQNASRDSAEFAWIPDGGACAFCTMLASRGWQKATRELRNSHADHIHANCGCEFAIRFDKSSSIKGYNPEQLRKEYNEAAPGKNSTVKLNALRREQYEDNKDEINEQKRVRYAEINKEN